MNEGGLVSLAPRHLCTGCKACGDQCPKHCITFKNDEDGFWYPLINNDICIKCHSCERVCPVINPKKVERIIPKTYASWASREIRKKSASGGLFYALASHLVKEGGYVSGAVFDGYLVRHILTNRIDDLERIQGTKYFQSDTSGVYGEIKRLLQTGTKVLFSGTSCQVAGLLNIVGNERQNLITVDLICYGVPSTLTIKVEERMRGKKLKRIISNRDKNHVGGWRNCYYMTCEWDDGSQTVSSPQESFMLAAFNSGKVMRVSCYNCFYKNVKRQADITIGDYHNVKDFDEEKTDGISLVMTHTPEGDNLLKSISGLSIYERPIEECLNGKRTIYYNDSLYGGHPMRKAMTWMLRYAPLWLLNVSYRSLVKSKNPLVWPFTAFDFLYREINQRRANKRMKAVLNQIYEQDENRSIDIS